jgi:dTDP-4-amino-4,6-dideoxygalactose transaminase
LGYSWLVAARRRRAESQTAVPTTMNAMAVTTRMVGSEPVKASPLPFVAELAPVEPEPVAWAPATPAVSPTRPAATLTTSNRRWKCLSTSRSVPLTTTSVNDTPAGSSATPEAGEGSTIPYNRPTIAGRTLEYVDRAIRAGHLAGDGPCTRQVEEQLRLALGAAAVLLTPSCTHALEMAGLLLEVQHGDEVVLPSFNFPSAANAFLLRGARPVFVDIRADTLNLDERCLESALTPRTRAIVVVHYAGVSCEMDPICAIAARHGVPIVEDIAHSLFGSYHGRPSGSFGDLSTASFHETKNLTCGEGGALVINRPDLVERAEIIREKGTNRTAFHRGEVSRYSWVDLGSSYLAAELLAAVLLAQLEERREIEQRRRAAWLRYACELSDWAAASSVGVPVVPEGCDSAHHLFHLLLPDLRRRDALLEHLRRLGILAVFHYLPLHLSPMGRQLGGRPGDLPVTESVSDRIVRLPLFSDLTEGEQSAVISAVTSFDPSR